MNEAYPFYLAGRPVWEGATMPVTDKYTGATVSRVTMANRAAIESAIDSTVQAAEPMRRMPAHKRQAILQSIVSNLQRHAETLARVMVIESGKTIHDARGEVGRAMETFRIAAEEAVRIHGEYLSLNISQRVEGYEGITKRVPVGPCSFITPFNFPLNLVAHKVAPAIAMGCPFVLKPAPQTPVSAILLGDMLAQTELPAGAFSIVPCEVVDATPLVEDDRIKLLSFTGSAAVGWSLKSKAGKKKVVLELGGNAACIVDRDADLDAACKRIIFGAFYQSGQSCISVQRLLIHQDVYEVVSDRVVKDAAALKSGDPSDESVFLGPLISERDAQRIERWVKEALEDGAKILCGGRRHGSFYDATILENVPRDAQLFREEAFGPVLILEPFARFEDALTSANDSRYGLQAGVFTGSLKHAWLAFDELQVGGVIINDVPSMRIDSMPYGGVKDSGLGREGVRYAMQEMSEIRLMLMKKG